VWATEPVTAANAASASAPKMMREVRSMAYTTRPAPAFFPRRMIRA
jgi:hypothetical protein